MSSSSSSTSTTTSSSNTKGPYPIPDRPVRKKLENLAAVVEDSRSFFYKLDNNLWNIYFMIKYYLSFYSYVIGIFILDNIRYTF